MSTDDGRHGHDEQEEVGAWGGTGYVRREPDPTVVAWWQQLPEATRAELAALRPGQVLPRGAAHALQVIGVQAPEVVVTEDGRRVRRGVASRDVISTVLMVRLTHSERRLV
ncbi:hypothetical protein [Kineococcus rhizosphaerae]|uniref:Uncharacterized protein n=1 Tax=Kineococcus rhizosphaerae TaxID=559628 RepID=A0A2T0R377_9ACTN|nr:hypothetical protein [Kineococcus rhizosphaerae]PRY14494.1 hypothetical protein CLV37_10652 [Kineococcus rhizosphaerae]